MSTYLQKGFTLQGSGELEYTILEMIGRGATCAVYLANGKDAEGNVTEHILKEYNPVMLDIKRSGDGQLVVSDGEKEKFSGGLERFRAGYERQLSVRGMSGLKNTTTNIQRIFQAAGTWYIDMTVFEGCVYSRLEEPALYTLLRRMKALVRVIGGYHEAGLLHLDIKPDNVFTIPETCEMVMLYDFDSVIKKGEVGSARGFSYTEEWAAPELSTPALRKNVCEATDLYAVGRILFFKIFGRQPSAAECRPFAEYAYDRGAVLFKDVDPQVFPLLTDLFHHTLCASITKRYQSAEELFGQLEKLLELADPKRPYLCASAPVPGTFFIGRDREIGQIHEMLREKGIVFLTGTGGIGKSELARNYAESCRSEYGTILYTSYNGSITALVNDDTGLHIANFARSKYEDEESYFKRKIEKMKELGGPGVLFVIDNLDVFDFTEAEQEALNAVFGTGCRFLVTSRIREWEYGMYEVPELSEEDLMELFFHYSGCDPADSGERKTVNRIIKHAGGHTLTVELIARQIKAGFLTPSQICDRLREQGIFALGRELVSARKDGVQKKQTVLEHISLLFDLTVERSAGYISE